MKKKVKKKKTVKTYLSNVMYARIKHLYDREYVYTVEPTSFVYFPYCT